MQIPVGASLLAIAVCQSHLLWMCNRHREQARSHSCFVSLAKSLLCLTITHINHPVQLLFPRL